MKRLIGAVLSVVLGLGLLVVPIPVGATKLFDPYCDPQDQITSTECWGENEGLREYALAQATNGFSAHAVAVVNMDCGYWVPVAAYEQAYANPGGATAEAIVYVGNYPDADVLAWAVIDVDSFGEIEYAYYGYEPTVARNWGCTVDQIWTDNVF